MVIDSYRQIPSRVHWRWAAAEIARCLGDKALAGGFNSTRDATCCEAEYLDLCALLARSPHPQPTADGQCLCRVPVLYDAPLVTLGELGILEPAKTKTRHSPADLGLAGEKLIGCVGRWHSMVGVLAFGSRNEARSGRSGQPRSERQLKGALTGLVNRIDLARRPVAEDGVVTPSMCAALLLFFDVFSNGSRGRNPALPRIVQHRGVAEGKSLRALARKIYLLTRDQR
jgi:hypothetical protein